MARPKRGNYATGPEGQARYRKAVTAYLKKQKEAREKKTKITSTKKNIAKQKATNKKAATTTKAKATAKPTATAKPKATTAKAQNLATGKTSQTKTTAATTTTTTRRKTTTKPKTQIKSKTTTKTGPKSKTPARTIPKRKPFDAQKRGPGRPKGSTKTTGKSAPKNNNTLKIKNAAKQTGNFLKDTAKKGYNLGKKGVNKIQTKLAAKDQTPQQSVPEGKSKGAKVAKGLNKRITNYAKQVYNKAALDTFKFKTITKDPSMRKANMKGVKGGLVSSGALLASNALINRLTKPKGMTIKEWEKKKAEMEQASYDKRRKLVKKAYKGVGNLVKKGVNKLRGKSGESSTTKNINKQKKTNNTGLKIKKTERSSKVNRNKDYNAKTATKKRNTGLSEFRVDPKENRKLQLEAQNKKPITYSRQLSNQAKKTKKSNVTTTKSPRPGSARAKMIAKNEARFGKARVDKLRKKNQDFQAMKKKKMTKAEFIRRYPNSQTAKREKGLR